MIIKCDVVIESFYYFLRLYVRSFLALWRSKPNMLYLICLPQFQNSYYFKMISCEYKVYGYYINNLYSVLISYLNPNIFVVLGKPL